ncbi:ubiquitin-protein ligase E3 [Schizosaccharomyces cryophilus OY26]|uniref:Ubiquitin-protein ligase E3 n=1 Tax=Schizosaccharomyces cryophilus (strain OY26 / ATCC MYA-4695 / CBS 11777 / NBRC 106824 / NRRL Y48691) TaxID=653667 RepID=S9W580_SCHCR|nr:ubiquitin-protein ligase E3 [Schizosaccharomyces cryophilus OY26]EPY53709.1 ubiquitin-protein ligase E3 [Schizosaccharomyces cryophilus OY26]
MGSINKLNVDAPSFTPNQASSSHAPNKGKKAEAGSSKRSDSHGSSKKSQGMPRKNQPSASGGKSHKSKTRPSKKTSAVSEAINDSLEDAQNEHDDHLFDILSARTNRRGQISLNHLLNFQFAPRNTYSTMSAPPRRTRQYNTYGYGSGYHPMDKARYVNANYRFIVSPLGEYQYQKLDPDSPVKWEDVWQVLCSSDFQVAVCPFCLGEKPVAARMSRCGHAFCLPCLLRYMETPTNEEVKAAEHSGSKVPKCGTRTCPICLDVIRIRDIRPIRWVQDEEFQKLEEGKLVCLRLYQRNVGSILAFPRAFRSFAVDGSFHTDSFPNVSMDGAAYARIIIGTHEYMLQQYSNEIEQLAQVAAEDVGLYGVADCYYEKATAKLLDQTTTLSSSLDQNEQTSLAANIDNLSLQDNALKQLSSVEDLEKTTGDSEETDSYLFYQPSAHSHVYLAPLDIRILKTAFGSYARFPNELQPVVERISSGHSVNTEFRQRFKYMGHLPEGCEVAFIECDWSKVVPEETLKVFRTEINKRRKQRKAQETREEKYRQRAQRATEDQIFTELNMQRPIPRQIIQEENTAEAFPTLESLNVSGEGNSSTRSNDENEIANTLDANQRATERQTIKTVWGTHAISGASHETDESEDLDAWKVDWEKIANMSANSKNSKNKKKKKLVLLSTGGGRRLVMLFTEVETSEFGKVICNGK